MLRIPHCFIGVILFWVCPLMACGASSEESKAVLYSDVCQVMDGDTFRTCEGHHVRLRGIDAPELGEFYYANATETLRRLIEGKTVRIAECIPVNNFQVCRIRVGKKDIAREMVLRGAAYDWPKYSKGLYQSAEKTARKNKHGFWSADAHRRTHWDRKHQY